MAPFSVIIFGVVVWTTAVSGAKQLRFRILTMVFVWKRISVDGAFVTTNVDYMYMLADIVGSSFTARGQSE